MRPPDGDGLRRDLLRAACLAALPATMAHASAAPLGTAPRAGSAPLLADDAPFTFGFIGDTPYNWLDELALQRVLGAMADEPLAFVLHAGDVKSGGDTCTDTLLSARIGMLDRSPHPLILTPGDNDWTDCAPGRAATEPGGALERLEWLRRHVYAKPLSLGERRMPVEQQQGNPRLPENLRWRIGSLQFCTLHVVGSNNGASRDPALARAWSYRQEANARWLTQTVELALRERARGLVLALHANMRFERDHQDGWRMMRQLVVAAAAAFKGPVLLLHGDTHRFRSDRLLLRSHGLTDFYRVECFGSPFTWSWVSIRWNPAAVNERASTAADAALPASPFEVSTRSAA